MTAISVNRNRKNARLVPMRIQHYCSGLSFVTIYGNCATCPYCTLQAAIKYCKCTKMFKAIYSTSHADSGCTCQSNRSLITTFTHHTVLHDWLQQIYHKKVLLQQHDVTRPRVYHVTTDGLTKYIIVFVVLQMQW